MYKWNCNKFIVSLNHKVTLVWLRDKLNQDKHKNLKITDLLVILVSLILIGVCMFQEWQSKPETKTIKATFPDSYLSLPLSFFSDLNWGFVISLSVLDIYSCLRPILVNMFVIIFPKSFYKVCYHNEERLLHYKIEASKSEFTKEIYLNQP